MKIALTPEQIAYIKQEVVAPLAKINAQVFVFGSRSTNKNNKFSDLDLLIRPKDNSNELKSLISKINENLIEGSFPYKVDIVIEDEIAESYRKNILSQLVQI